MYQSHNNRASEDCTPWERTQEVTIHQVIHKTHDGSQFVYLFIQLQIATKTLNNTVVVGVFPVSCSMRLNPEGTKVGDVVVYSNNNRASEDCPPQDCSHTPEVTIHQVTLKTYDCPRLIN